MNSLEKNEPLHSAGSQSKVPSKKDKKGVEEPVEVDIKAQDPVNPDTEPKQDTTAEQAEDPMEDIFLDFDGELLDEHEVRITELEEEVSAHKEQLEQLDKEKASLQEEIDKLQKNVKGKNDQIIRKAADFENFRRRVKREKTELQKFANDKLLAEFLAIIDNLERALEHGNNDKSNPLIEGLTMTLEQIKKLLAKFHVLGFESLGETFDPEKHEALQQLPSDEYSSGQIMTQYQKGYFLHDRLLRPALVVVSAGPGKKKKAGSEKEPTPEEPTTIDITVEEALSEKDQKTEENSVTEPETSTSEPVASTPESVDTDQTSKDSEQTPDSDTP